MGRSLYVLVPLLLLLVLAPHALVKAHEVHEAPASNRRQTTDGKALGSTKDSLQAPHEDHHHHEEEPKGKTLHSPHDHHHGDHDHVDSKAKAVLSTGAGVWVEAILATVLVGAAPILVLIFIPVGQEGQEGKYDSMLKVLLAFAAGGLLGDSFLHLLPHALESSSAAVHHHHHHHEGEEEEGGGHSHTLQDLAPWLWTISGIITFWLLEKLVRQISAKSGHGHSHSHSGDSRAKRQAEEETSSSSKKGGSETGDDSTLRRRKPKQTDESQTPATEEEEEKRKRGGGGGSKPIAPAGYLNLAADFSHNFTDGLALGATFLQGKGLSTTVAILLHEVPHEIGDFAILIQSGFTRRQAMWAQLWTAGGCLVGTLIGLAAGNVGGAAASWISPFTAGGFMYIATVTVLPELLHDSSFFQTLQEFLAMVLGIGLMVGIALTEE